jgi:hypothetical protein
MSILDDYNTLIEETQNSLKNISPIKHLWKSGKVKDIEDLLNESYTHNKTFKWKYMMWDGNFSYGKMNNYVNTSIFLCDLDMDREGRLVLKFDLVKLHTYFKDKEKEEKFIQDMLSLFGNCMKETFFKPQIEICYGY